MYRVVINMESEKSANHLKKEIEKTFPLIEGKVRIQKEPEFKPFDEIVKEIEG
jgi:hypothetical protein